MTEECDVKEETKNSDYFDMCQVGSDREQKNEGTAITPITKYVELSSKMLIELRNQNPKTGLVSEHTCNDENDDDNDISRHISTNASNQVQDENKHTLKHQHRATEVLGTTDAKKISFVNTKVIKPSNGANFNDYLKNIRSNMSVARVSSVRIKHTANTDHNALAESGVDYGSPGSFSDRARAFIKVQNATPLRGGRQVREKNWKILTIFT